MRARRTAAGSAVAVALLLAACSGSDRTTLTTAAGSAPPPAAAPSAEAPTASASGGSVAVAPAPATTPAAPTTKAATAKAKPATPAPAKPAPRVDLTPLRSGAGTSYATTVTHRAGEEFGTGTVRLWLPDKIGSVRGVVVGGFFPGQPAADPKPDADLLQLALKYHLAVVTQTYTHLAGTRDRREAYCDHGSARGMARGLTAIAGRAKHPEIGTAPLVVAYGYSLAGLCAKGIAETFPQRTAVLVYGGMSRVDCTKAGVPSVPTLVYGGGNDGFVENIPNEIGQCRAKGMPIAVALKPGAGHGVRGSSGMRDAYLDGVLAVRLPQQAGGALRRIDVTTGYLADNSSHAATAYNAFGGDRTRASWLPTAASAAAWKAWTTSR